MAFFYSPSTSGFYDSDYSMNIPDDVIKLTLDERDSLLHAINHQGKSIVVKHKTIKLVDSISHETWDTIRLKRNILLKESDYTQMPDYPTNREKWAKYRQLLRDIPQKYDNPDSVIWPDKPNG